MPIIEVAVYCAPNELVLMCSPGVLGFLVGEALMRAALPGAELGRLFGWPPVV